MKNKTNLEKVIEYLITEGYTKDYLNSLTTDEFKEILKKYEK